MAGAARAAGGDAFANDKPLLGRAHRGVIVPLRRQRVSPVLGQREALTRGSFALRVRLRRWFRGLRRAALLLP